MRCLFTSKNVVIMALIAIICLFLVNMFTKREASKLKNHYKKYNENILNNDYKTDNTYTYKNRTVL